MRQTDRSLAIVACDEAAVRLSSVSAIVPVHDEAATIVGVAASLVSALPGVAGDWELILVDDGSRDATPRLADELARTRANVRVVRHAVKRGYGAAVRSGLAAARHDWVFLTDGDGQFDPARLGDLLPFLGDADAVLGYRVRRADRWHRRLFAVAWNALVRALLGIRTRDVNCAFKLLRRERLDGLDARAEGGAISAELLAHLARRGAAVVEVPVPHFPRRAGRASGGSPHVAARACLELVGIWWRRRRR